MDGHLVWQRMQQGNKRFVKDNLALSETDLIEQRLRTAREGQEPLAAVLCCADSRVPPELLFDVGLGELFVVRLAGQVPSDEAIASLEFAVLTLGIKLILIKGHTKCGAVHLAIRAECGDFKAPSAVLGGILDHVRPAAALTLKGKRFEANDTISPDAERLVLDKHVALTSSMLLERSEIIRRAVEENRVVIKAAVYDIHQGNVDEVSESGMVHNQMPSHYQPEKMA